MLPLAFLPHFLPGLPHIYAKYISGNIIGWQRGEKKVEFQIIQPIMFPETDDLQYLKGMQAWLWDQLLG